MARWAKPIRAQRSLYNVHNYCKGSKPTEKEAQIRTNSLKGDMRETCDNSGKKHTWEAYDS